ncbi:MAG: TerB family tellurite resistance protein [Gammaproteobacteria bacterium]|nr:TerB family tellurite resistance protein [Gammaproteobacteria bacterium]
MIGPLRRLLRQLGEQGGASVDPDQVPLAMAALLVEAARADHHVREDELEEISVLLAVRLDLDPEQATGLVQRARQAVERSVSLYEFTHPLHQALDYRQKQELVRMLWHVVLADRRLDKYEDYLIGKVSELLYVLRGDVLRLRHEVQQAQDAAGGGD